MEIKEAVDALEKKIKEYKDSVSETTKNEIKALKDAYDAAKVELEKKVDEIHKAVEEKGGTIGDLQNDVKELKAKSGHRFMEVAHIEKGMRNIIAGQISRAIAENKADIIQSANGGSLIKPIEIKAAGPVHSSNLSENYISYLDWQAGMEPTGQFHLRNLVRTILSETDFVQYPRANNPIGEGSFGRQTEGQAKAQVDRDYTMVDLTLKPMAAFVIVSRQAMRNIIFLQSWLPTSLLDQMEDGEDVDFANTLVAAATGSTATTRTEAVEKIISYIKNLIKGKYNPNGIAVDPDVWEDFLTFRPGTDNPYSLPSVVGVTPTGQITIMGRPIYPVNWLANRRVIVGDWTKAAIVQSEGLRLRQSDSHASIFTSNELAILLERTEGLAIFRPDAFVTTTV